MKSTILTLALTLAPALFTSTSFGLVREQASCATSDGAYAINVSENLGIGLVRPSPGPMIATVSDANYNVLVSVPVEIFKGVQSVSFGRPQYRDLNTAGDMIKLEGPSTNFKNYVLNANLVVNGKQITIKDENLSCSVFLGIVL